jgi:7,8-dihydro-6-hydroxymethylpterin-pyrophosphokinase
LTRLLRVEHALGRSREVTMGPRTIDLDLLLYGGETRATELLTLPHARLHLRRFVLTPLVELCATLVHPTLGRTISDLLQNVEDTSDVQLWNPRSQ